MKIYRPINLELTDDQIERLKQYSRDIDSKTFDLSSFMEHEEDLGYSIGELIKWRREFGDLLFKISIFD